MPHSVHDSSATMSRPSSTSTGSANAFPRPAGVTLLAPETARDQLTPADSTLSFDSSHRSVQPVSERGAIPEETRSTTPASRGAPAGKKGYTTRQRNKYFEEQFAYKDGSTSSARERVIKDAPIVADLRTNVIIKDEYTLVTDLSHHLSQRYQRPESSIMITVNHSACLLLGGSFEPTYVLTISALPVQLQPTTNKRNAALIQTFMFESIGVHSERGIVKFVPIPEECLATNGMTVLGDIERMERQQADANPSLIRDVTKSSKRSIVAKAKSSMQLSKKESPATGEREGATPFVPTPGPVDSGVSVNEEEHDCLAPLQPGDGAASQKHSAIHSSKPLREKPGPNPTTTGLPAPSANTDDSSGRRIGKQRSFLTLFRR